VKGIAGKLYKNRPLNDIDYGDYYQYGLIGLIEAVDRYDPHREASFSTFATYRIKGAILNGLKESTERRSQVGYWLRAEKDRTNSAMLGLPHQGKRSLFTELMDATLELAIGLILQKNETEESAPASSLQGDAYSCHEMGRLATQIRDIAATLPDKERTVIQYHYYHQIGFDDIGSILGITKGRVSQIHKQGLLRIREAIEGSKRIDTLY
jgi:RNA polymerase sigma factor for flagellar operon FliA